MEGIARFHDLIAPFADDPAEVVIGIETDRGLFVAALVAAGYDVYAVNPMSTSRYRDRHSASGAKSDAGDAKVLADMVRTDRHNHRIVAGDTEGVEALKVLARAHQRMVWSRGRQTNLLRSTLREFYPAALVAFDDLSSPDALEVLRIAPTPTLGANLSQSKIAAALRRGGRQRRIDESAVKIQTALRSEQLQAPPVVATAMGASVAANVAVITEMCNQIAQLAAELEANFEQHPDAEVVRSLPGLGTVLGARVLGEFGDEPNRYATAKSRRITPARRPSPGRRAPNEPCSLATSATNAWLMPSTSGPSRRSPPHRGPASTTTSEGRPVTATTKPCVPSATGSSASSTDASLTTSLTTRRSPGATERRAISRKPLDIYDRGMSNPALGDGASPARVRVISIDPAWGHLDPVRRPVPGNIFDRSDDDWHHALLGRPAIVGYAHERPAGEARNLGVSPLPTIGSCCQHYFEVLLYLSLSR